MSLIAVILVLIAVGVLLWAVKAIPYIDPSMKTVITVVSIVAVVLWIASLYGLFGHLSTVRVGK